MRDTILPMKASRGRPFGLMMGMFIGAQILASQPALAQSTISSPANGATVSGVINIDNYWEYSNLYVDGNFAGSSSHVSAFQGQFTLDTRQYGDGWHTIDTCDTNNACEDAVSYYFHNGFSPPGNFTYNGGVFYENAQGHACGFEDPSYLNSLGGGNYGPTLSSWPNAIFDGDCDPIDLIFNNGYAVYYENEARHFCWISNPAYLQQLNGGNPGPYLDILPRDATYDGICPGD
jgi:hypothetical protein